MMISTAAVWAGVACEAWITPAGAAVGVADSLKDPPQRVVKYDDLNLSTDSGARGGTSVLRPGDGVGGPGDRQSARDGDARGDGEKSRWMTMSGRGVPPPELEGRDAPGINK
jgi:hypothetical protein